ncbi:hypothetical protein, partial [Pseudomonas sp.]|uniref:hypothetical protein n=1 Tax=Pseudomonas sp. TaxID=306 RepID=UPI0025CBE36E
MLKNHPKRRECQSGGDGDIKGYASYQLAKQNQQLKRNNGRFKRTLNPKTKNKCARSCAPLCNFLRTR